MVFIVSDHNIQNIDSKVFEKALFISTRHSLDGVKNSIIVSVNIWCSSVGN